MIPFASPLLHAAAVGGNPYDRFLAHITERASGAFVAFSGRPGGNLPYVTTAVDPVGLSMVGSSWGPSAASGIIRNASSTVGRAVQHGLPNEATFNRIVASGLSLLVDPEDFGINASYTGVNRNGYSSLNSSTSGVAARITEITWWEPDLAEARTINPTAATPTVTPYTGHL